MASLAIPSEVPAILSPQLEATRAALAICAVNVARGRELRVVDNATATFAAEVMNGLKNGAKALEAVRAEAVRPHLDAQKALNGFANPVIAECEAVSRMVGRDLAKWQQEQEEKARAEAEAREKARREAEAVAEKARKDAEVAAATNDPDALDKAIEADVATQEAAKPIAVSPLPSNVTKATSAAGSVTFRDVVVFRVVDPQAVPRELLSVDEKKVGAAVRALSVDAVRAGDVKIAGIELTVEKQPVRR